MALELRTILTAWLNQKHIEIYVIIPRPDFVYTPIGCLMGDL